MKKHSNHMKLAAWILSLMMLVSILPAAQVNAATQKVKISQTKVTLTVGKTKTLSLKNVSKKQKKKIKWTSSKKSVATVSKSGKVKAKKAGTATITAKLGRKKYRCKIVVKKKTKKKKSSKKTEDDLTIEDICKPKRSQLYKKLGINSSTKPQYAAFLLAKWECDHVSYGKSRSVSVYDALLTGKGIGVCEDYTDLYSFLLEGLGIQTKDTAREYPEYASKFNHSYNQIKIDGKWYAVDVTCMDQADSIADCGGDEGVRYDMTQFLVPGKYLAFENKNRGADSTRFLKAIYDSNLAFNKNYCHVDEDLKESYESSLRYDNRFGGYVDKDNGDLVRLYTNKNGDIVWESKKNYLKYWDSNKNFIGNLQNKGNPEYAEHDYRFNPWFTGQWQSY